MAENCGEVLSENKKNNSSSPCDPRAARRRRMEIRRVKFVAGAQASIDNFNKRPKQPVSYSSSASSFSIDFRNAVENCYPDEKQRSTRTATVVTDSDVLQTESSTPVAKQITIPYVLPAMFDEYPKYGMSSVCGRRKDMEDAIAIHPSFCGHDQTKLDYYGVYDGHGCSHVAMKCRDRLHNIVKEEILNNRYNCSSIADLYIALEKSLNRMDKEVIAYNEGSDSIVMSCRCKLRTPECDAVGSTAVVSIVSSGKIIVVNCGDSRAVLCRNGKAIPLSYDHKPDRPDELDRIQSAGGRVMYWEGARVLGVLATSRAIGDNYLKPYVSCEPEITVTDRTAEDDLLILASDGLWDVVSNDTACAVARRCLRGKIVVSVPSLLSEEVESSVGAGNSADKACSDAATLLTKLALARHSTDNVSVVVVDLKRDVIKVD